MNVGRSLIQTKEMNLQWEVKSILSRTSAMVWAEI